MSEPQASIELLVLLRELYHDADVPRWLESRQALFDGEIPNEMIAQGREGELIRSLRQLLDGAYS
jgi:hypothetical protein